MQKIFIDVQMVLQFVTILLLVLRVKSVCKRLARRRRRLQQEETNKLMLKKYAEKADPNKKSLYNLSYNMFTSCAQFLNIDDLARLECTCKKFKIYCDQSEFLYERLWNRHWATFTTIQNFHGTFKQNCIQQFKIKKQNEGAQPISEESKDKILGSHNIIFEEFLISLVDIPHTFILLPKALGYLFHKKIVWRPNPELADNPRAVFDLWLNEQRYSYPNLFILEQYHVYYSLYRSIAKEEFNDPEHSSNSFQNIHEQAIKVVTYFAYLKIFFRYVYLLNLPVYYLLKLQCWMVAPHMSLFRSYIVYLSHFISLLILVPYYLVLVAGLQVYSYFFTDLQGISWIVGPCLLYLVNLAAAVISILVFLVSFMGQVFLEYRPFHILVMMKSSGCNRL